MTQQFDSCVYIWKNKNTNSERHMYPNAHSSIIYNTKLWKQPVSISRGTDKADMAYKNNRIFSSVQFSSVTQLCLTLCNLMDCSTPGLPVHNQLLEFTKTHVHWVSDSIQPSHPLSSPSPPTFNLSQNQGIFKWVSSSLQVAKVLGVSTSASVLPKNIHDWFTY